MMDQEEVRLSTPGTSYDAEPGAWLEHFMQEEEEDRR